MICTPSVPSRRATICGVLVLYGAMGCSVGSDDSAAADTATTDTVAVAAADTGMTGMDHSSMAGMSRPAPRDSNQVFLRMMSDHHEGMIGMADSAEGRAQDSTARADARELREKQRREQQEMLTILGRQYQDSITPMLMSSNRTMIDSIRSATGADVDPMFYRQVAHHHREGIAMAEALLPHLTGEVRQMADRMVAEQRREVEEFERKAQSRAGG
jgi:uncharacterized protein (DUF305 family)